MRAQLSLVILVLSAVPARAQALPEGPGKEAYVKVCGACHALNLSLPRLDGAAWAKLVLRMVDFGAEATKQEREAIVTYLTSNFGPAAAGRINVNKATAGELEAGLKLTSKESQAIVRYRDLHGPFKDSRDLAKVEGIAPGKIDAAKDRISTSDPAPPPREKRSP